MDSFNSKIKDYCSKKNNQLCLGLDLDNRKLKDSSLSYYKDFMFDMATNVLKKDHGISIEGDERIKEIYLKDMEDIFENNDFVEI